MVEAVDPGLGSGGQRSALRADVVRFAIVVPRHDLNHVHARPDALVRDQVLPLRRVQVVVREEDKL